MADWTDPPWAQLVAGKPWTDEKAAAAFENVLALAEGANGAPRVLGKALGGIYLGRVSTPSGNPWLGFTGLDGHGLIAFFFTSSNINLRARFTADNGSTWGSEQVFANAAAYFGLLMLNLQTGDYAMQAATAVDSSINAGGKFTVPSGCNGFQVRTGASAAYSGFALSLGGLE